MIRLSTGVELSEDTVVSALKKAGIRVEPKHVFEAGDVAYNSSIKDLYSWRLIFRCNGGLYSINQAGTKQGDGSQEYFEHNHYRYVGRQKDLLRIS